MMSIKEKFYNHQADVGKPMPTMGTPDFNKTKKMRVVNSITNSHGKKIDKGKLSSEVKGLDQSPETAKGARHERKFAKASFKFYPPMMEK